MSRCRAPQHLTLCAPSASYRSGSVFPPVSARNHRPLTLDEARFAWDRWRLLAVCCRAPAPRASHCRYRRAVFAAACSDQPPVAPRNVAPGTPRCRSARRSPRCPRVAHHSPLEVPRVLTAPTATPSTVEAPSSATAPSSLRGSDCRRLALFSLALLRSTCRAPSRTPAIRSSRCTPATIRTPPPALVYDGPDANVATSHRRKLTPAALGTTTLAVTGATASGQPVPSIRVGWTSKDPTSPRSTQPAR